MSKYSLKRVSHKVKKHAVEVAKRSAALCFLVVIVVGLLLPAGVGYMMKAAGNVGVNTLVASSADVNNSLFTGISAYYRDGTNGCNQNVVSLNGYNYFIVTNNNPHADSCSPLVFSQIKINTSGFNDVDIVKVRAKCVEDNSLLNGSGFYFIGANGNSKFYYLNYDNKTGYWVADIPIEPAILLKEPNTLTLHFCKLGASVNKLVGKTIQYRVEAYDTKGINAVTTKNIMLGASGILLLAVGLCATPWINPSQWYDELFNRRNRRRR